MSYNNSYVGTQVGNYRVTSELASGGFGSVYLAQHTILSGRLAVFKVLHAVYLSAQNERESFLQEAQLLEKLKHPHILPIFDVGLYQNMVPYIIAEYAQHGSLRDRTRRANGRPLPTAEALRILSQVSEALQHAHQQNIIHRDLKPENILFNAQDETLLADFGIATTLTTASVKVGQIAGTPLYMAPEQFKGMVSKESDQYALGCIAYELFTGHTPFESADFMAMAYQHVHEQPKPPRQLNPALPVYMEQTIMKALSKERHDRYSSVTAFITALQSPSIPPPPPPPPIYQGGQRGYQQVGLPPVQPYYQTPPVQQPYVAMTPPVQGRAQQIATPPVAVGQETSTNPTGGDRTWAALCYLSPFFAAAYVVGWIVFALICYFAGRKRPFVRFHFMQSQLFFIISTIIFLITGFSVQASSGSSAAGSAAATVLGIYIVLSLIYMILAAVGKRAHVPIIGGIASAYAKRVK